MKTETLGLRILRKLYGGRKILLGITAIYFLTLIIYDIVKWQRPIIECVITYFIMLIVITAAYWSMQLVLFIQAKSQFCSTGFLNFGLLFFIVGCLLATALIGFDYFATGFLIAGFVPPVMFISVVFAQGMRDEFKLKKQKQDEDSKQDDTSPVS